ncbi:hypothetical protein AHYW_001380 [Providencia manganoxydans]|uniref:hypothetical protein n=1 Tax=Providencia manganoxydans TaxID=2923283 RepID=UPI003DA08FE4
MCNKKSDLEKLAEMAGKNIVITPSQEKLKGDVFKRVSEKAALKKELLNQIFYSMNICSLDIGAVYEVLNDVRNEFDYGLGNDEIPF